MLHLTDLILTPERSPADSADWLLPQATLALLSRVAATSLPVLCLDCYGVAFVRIATAVHRDSGRDQLVLVDLRRTAGTLPAGLPDRAHAARTTLALDGLERLDRDAQQLLARQLVAAPYRLLTATGSTLADLRPRWPADLFAVVSTITVHAPTLARRGDDAIAALARRRLALLCAALGRSVPELSPGAVQALIAHDWPGDVNELDAVLARSAVLSDGAVLESSDLRLRSDPPQQSGAAPVVVAGTRAEHAPAAPAPAVAEPAAAPAAPTDHRDQPSARRPAPLELASGPSPTLEALAVELAHQLKNPLVTVKTFVASIESLSQDPHELGQFRVLTDDAVTRMDEILEGLLSFARLGAAAPESRDVLPLLRDALRATWRGFSSKQVTLEAPDGRRCFAYIDLEHVRFALGALARHIAETIEPRGTLRITIEPDGALCFTYKESGAITHLRGAANAQDSGLPLALLLVRGALGRVGGDVEIALDSNAVSIRLRLAPP